MPDTEEDKQTGNRGAEADQGCPVKMYEGQRCGRPVYGAPPGIDKNPVCLMHSRDPNKDDGAFQAEFERILKEAGEGIADFTRFVFAGGGGGKRRLVPKCVFQHAVFLDDARFVRAVFEQEPDFNSATFKRRAIFVGTSFLQGVDFSESLFEGKAHFTRARFRETADLMGTEFREAVAFRGCRFGGQALFVGAAFRNPVEFAGSSFAGEAGFDAVDFADRADFTLARFEGTATWREAHFGKDANFGGARFLLGADFVRARFGKRALFALAAFQGSAGFDDATFESDAMFGCSRFTEAPRFERATFAETAEFVDAVFEMGASFMMATFAGVAQFRRAEFVKTATFYAAVFAEDADFTWCTFKEHVDFGSAIFKQAAHFRRTVFRRDPPSGDRSAGPVFTLAFFENPHAVVFYGSYLGQGVLLQCDVSRVTFSEVEWRLRPSGKRMVFEEMAELGPLYFQVPLEPREGSPDERNYALIAELYQQLKKNYDDRRDYWTAGDFHYGEMEMKRLAWPRLTWLAWLEAKLAGRPRLRKLGERCGKLQSNAWLLSKVRWWHQWFGLAAWYRRFSDYGESWGKPLVWLFAVLVLFAALYPLLGLRPAATKSPVAKTTSVQVQTPSAQETDLRYWSHERPRRLFWHSAMTSLGVAAFQRDLACEPSYPWGRLLALLELLLTSTLIALFLLAVRRQFRR